MTTIYIDADACPVKKETFTVAKRYSCKVILVANSWMRIPEDRDITLKVVGNGFDEADNWIVEQIGAEDVVVTADILLAGRCIKAGACAIGSTGKLFTDDNIGAAVAMRDLMRDLRESGAITGGPAPHSSKDRSRFLSQLDSLLRKLVRR